jgi:hypothetical protein
MFNRPLSHCNAVRITYLIPTVGKIIRKNFFAYYQFNPCTRRSVVRYTRK